MLIEKIFVLVLIMSTTACQSQNIDSSKFDIKNSSYYYFDNGIKNSVSFQENNYGFIEFMNSSKIPFRYELISDKLTLYIGDSNENENTKNESTGLNVYKKSNLKLDTLEMYISENGENLDVRSEDDNYVWIRSGGYEEIINGHPMLITNIPSVEVKCENKLLNQDILYYFGRPREVFSQMYNGKVYLADSNSLISEHLNFKSNLALNVQSQLVSKSTKSARIVIVADESIPMEYLSEFKNSIELVQGSNYDFDVFILGASSGKSCLIPLIIDKEQENLNILKDWINRQ